MALDTLEVCLPAAYQRAGSTSGARGTAEQQDNEPPNDSYKFTTRTLKDTKPREEYPNQENGLERSGRPTAAVRAARRIGRAGGHMSGCQRPRVPGGSPRVTRASSGGQGPTRARQGVTRNRKGIPSLQSSLERSGGSPSAQKSPSVIKSHPEASGPQTSDG